MRKRLALALLLLAFRTEAAELQSFTRGTWPSLLAVHAGRPTIVHFWGLTCAPCVVELPRWGELLRDRPDLLKERFKGILQKGQLNIDRLVVAKGSRESWCSGIGVRMDASGDSAGAVYHRRCRHVVGRGRAARGAGGIRRRAR